MYRIGQVAKLANDDNRYNPFYEKQELMDRDRRTEGGYRLYTEKDLNVYVLFVMQKSWALHWTRLQSHYLVLIRSSHLC